jgi:hypothetical protein
MDRGVHRKAQFKAGNARLISEINQVKLINLIRDRDGVSREELAKISGLSALTEMFEGDLSHLTAEMVENAAHSLRKIRKYVSLNPLREVTTNDMQKICRETRA